MHAWQHGQTVDGAKYSNIRGEEEEEVDVDHEAQRLLGMAGCMV